MRLFSPAQEMTKIQAVIFDLDNTLEDFAPAEAVAEASLAKRVAEQTGCKPMEFLAAFTEAKRNHNHTQNPMEYSRVMWIEDAVRNRSLALDAKEIQNLEHYYWDVIRTEVTLYPDAKSTLEALRKRGLKLALLTDSDGVKGLKRQRIDQLGLGGIFDVIVTSDDVGENKPSLKGFREILLRLNLAPTGCVMVGDHPEFDLAPAKRLGIKTVWNQQRIVIDRSFPFVDYKIKKVSEMLALPLFSSK
jgi:putative hydrolase of the HAD superfamily